MLKLKVSILALDAPSGNTQRSLDTGTFYQIWIWLWWLEESHSSRLGIPEWKTRCFLPVLLPCSAHIIISWTFFSCAQAENTAITCIMALPLESAIYGFFACFGTSFAVCTLDLLAWELGGQDHYKALALVCIAICSKLEEHVSYRTLGLAAPLGVLPCAITWRDPFRKGGTICNHIALLGNIEPYTLISSTCYYGCTHGEHRDNLQLNHSRL